MTEQNARSDGIEESALDLLQKIKSGLTDPKLLDKSSRQRCVELLVMEGYNGVQTAQILRCCEKTIARDLIDIRAKNALTPSVEFAKQTIGDLFRKAMNHHSYLMRLARAKDASNSEKIQAEFAAWRVLKEFIERMQLLGYLPMRPQEMVGDVFHHMEEEDDEKNIIDVRNMLNEIELTAKEAGTFDSETENQIRQIKARVEKAEIGIDAKKLKKKQNEAAQKKEKENEE